MDQKSLSKGGFFHETFKTRAISGTVQGGVTRAFAISQHLQKDFSFHIFRQRVPDPQGGVGGGVNSYRNVKLYAVSGNSLSGRVSQARFIKDSQFSEPAPETVVLICD